MDSIKHGRTLQRGDSDSREIDAQRDSEIVLQIVVKVLRQDLIGPKLGIRLQEPQLHVHNICASNV